MSEPIDALPLGTPEPQPWDRAAEPPVLPFMVQEAALEELLREEPVPLPVVEPPADLALDSPTIESAAPPFEEFKPTDAEWENVKEALLPHPDAVPLDEEVHPTHKPEILERDAQGRDADGDWNEV